MLFDVLVVPASFAKEAGLPLLWEIGKADQSNAEFALAPGGYAQFKDDGFFAIGSSDTKQDWPYVHPGPADAWAGSRPHTFIVLLGLKAAPAAGNGQIEIRLIDTHASGPPTVRVEVNGQAFEKSLPPGAGDASVHGEPNPIGRRIVLRRRDAKSCVSTPRGLRLLRRPRREAPLRVGPRNDMFRDSNFRFSPFRAAMRCHSKRDHGEGPFYAL